MKHLTLALVIGAISATGTISTTAIAATYDLPFKGQDFGDHEKVHTFDHAQNHSQKHGFDMGVRRYDFENNRWTSVTTSVADYNAAPTNNKFAVYNKPIYAMQEGKVVGCWRNAPENPRPKISGDSDTTKPWLHSNLLNGLMPGGGNMLWVEHNDGSRMLYAHMIPGTISSSLCPHHATAYPAAIGNNSEMKYIAVPAAQQASISKGQYLGRVGNSGNSTGPHLHIHLQDSSGEGQLITFQRGIAAALDDTKPYPSWTRFAGSTIPAGSQLIWAPRTVTSQYVRHGMKAEMMQGFFSHLADSGYKASWFDGYSVGSQSFYNVVWKPANLAWRGFFGQSAAGYQQVFNQAIADGYAPVQVDSHQTGNGTRYSVIFEKKPLVTLARHGLSYDQHMQVMEQAKSLNLRPVSVSVVSSNGERRYTVLYQQQHVGSWTVSSQLTAAAYQNKVNSELAAGRRSIYLNSYVHQGEVNYTAVFSQLPQLNWGAKHGQTSAQFQTQFNQFSVQGYMTDVVSGVDGLNQHNFGGIWSQN